MSRSEPTYWSWPVESLLKLVRLELETQPARTFHQKQRLAMKIAEQTGASYPWLLRHVEELSPPVRLA